MSGMETFFMEDAPEALLNAFSTLALSVESRNTAYGRRSRGCFGGERFDGIAGRPANLTCQA